MKLPKKLRIYKVTKNLKYKDIAEYTHASIQAVKDWCHEKRCPKKIKLHFARKLVSLTNNKITLSDCGHED